MTGSIRRAAAFPLVFCFVASGAAASGLQGPQLAAFCASCHLSAGGAIPPIVRNQGRIETAMLAYRSDPNSSQIMHVVARALSPEEITAVAQYLAAQQ